MGRLSQSSKVTPYSSPLAIDRTPVDGLRLLGHRVPVVAFDGLGGIGRERRSVERTLEGFGHAVDGGRGQESGIAYYLARGGLGMVSADHGTAGGHRLGVCDDEPGRPQEVQ